MNIIKMAKRKKYTVQEGYSFIKEQDAQAVGERIEGLMSANGGCLGPRTLSEKR